ncbi:MAG: indolepyruvate oxidoreductase subunit beta [Clostridiales bacterium]|jgi:indolepyruvate ferredoxin oxidoreductase beta subunit|nr:indolepyruvate oxidoreductase subunit beta [Clostridiales bacterium]
MFNCMIAGVGGQGTVLASKLIAAAAMSRGFNARTAETIGMAQRGGSVVSHVRVGAEIFSPVIPLGGADLLIAFEPAEGVRQLKYLSKGGLMVVCENAVKPASGALGGNTYDAGEMLAYLRASVSNLITANGAELAGENIKTLNVALLGIAAGSGKFPFEAGAFEEALQQMINPRFLEMNIKAFEGGKNRWTIH